MCGLIETFKARSNNVYRRWSGTKEARFDNINARDNQWDRFLFIYFLFGKFTAKFNDINYLQTLELSLHNLKNVAKIVT